MTFCINGREHCGGLHSSWQRDVDLGTRHTHCSSRLLKKCFTSGKKLFQQPANPGNEGHVQISWLAAAAGYILQKTTNLVPCVGWVDVPDVLISNDGQSMSTITVTNSTMFYRLTST
jgi:hypothetical protein